jgi:putative salt-induced outer membrane protein YdiY
MIATGLSIGLLALLSPTIGRTPAGGPLPPPGALALARADAAQEAATEGPKLPHWSGTVSVGTTFTRGNSETSTVAFAADIKREDEHDRYTLKSYLNYGEQRSTDPFDPDDDIGLTQRNAGLAGQYDYFPQEKWYLLGKAGIESNELAKLDVRYYAGPGAGYQFLAEEEHKLSGEGAIVYFKEEFEDAANTEDDKIALNLAYDYDWKISESAALGHYVDAFPAIDDPDDVFIKVDNRLTMNVTKSMIATLQYVMDFDHTPAPGAKQTDHRVIFTLGWTFGG